MSKNLWLVRHGESTANVERRLQGWLDYELTTKGRRQAARVAERLAAQDSIRRIVSSPLRRAATTAEIVGSVLGLPVEMDPRLREYDFGPLSGMTRDEIPERHPDVWRAWEQNDTWVPLPGEEGNDAFEARVGAAIGDIVAAMPHNSAAIVVTHGGTLNACLRAWFGIRDRGFRTFAFDNASLSLVQLRDSHRPDGPAYNLRLLELNSVSHLGELRGGRPAWFSAMWSPEDASAERR